jgi:hypothetical protein
MIVAKSLWMWEKLVFEIGVQLFTVVPYCHVIIPSHMSLLPKCAVSGVVQ